MRRPTFTASFDALPGELVVDCFAGGGGASEGIERALGRPVDIAINHDPVAIAMHQANHPETKHYCEDIFAVDPTEACGGRPVGLAWFSPDCTHHSRAKGKKPRDNRRRALADVVITWAEKVRPRVILLENVREFQDWGPLDEEGYPIKERAGEDFRAWCAKLVDLGYELEFTTLVAADYGTPTTRERLFLIARRDRGPRVWPTPTHGRGCPNPWRPAAEIIDWALPCRSIFGRDRPLAEATMRRIAAGLRKFVFEAADPFIIPVTHQGDARAHGIHEPVRTVTGAHRGELALVEPFLAKYHGGDRGHTRGQTCEEPLRTLDTSNRFALIEPFVVRHGHYSKITGAGLREGCGAGTFRGQPLEAPLATVCATNDKHLVVPFIAKSFGGPAVAHKQTAGSDVRRPLGTVTTKDHNNLVAAWLTKFYGSAQAGTSMQLPLPTVTTGGGRGGGHVAEVRAFLTKWYSGGSGKRAGDAQQQSLFAPLHTVTTKARFGLVMVEGVEYQIVDIGMRMLEPHELFAAQGFPESYDIVCAETRGKPLTKTEQTALAGNSVCPQIAEALVAANTRGEARRAAV